MNIPEWIKPAAYGAVVGGIAVAVVGFSWGGWVTGGSAQASALSAADASRADLAAAICVQNFMSEDGARDRLVELKELARATQQRTYIEDGTWAAMPDSDAVSRPVATLCARMLAELEPVELPVVEGGQVIEEGEVIEAEAIEAEAIEADAATPDPVAPQVAPTEEVVVPD